MRVAYVAGILRAAEVAVLVLLSTVAFAIDIDADGYHAPPVGGDCDDADPAIHPGAPELPGDNLDFDCNAVEDCYADADNDGARTNVVDPGGVNNDADCNDANEGRVGDPIDCNDGSAAIGPSVAEIAGDNVDQDCDGSELCYTDADNDGARLTTTFASADADCNDAAEGRTADPIDCNDANAGVQPFAAEVPGDGIDQNCDAVEDCYVDADADGARTTVVDPGGVDTDGDCDASGEGLSSDPLDCNDGDPWVSPAMPELCDDGEDNDCDGAIEPSLPTIDDSLAGVGGGLNEWAALGGPASSPVRIVGSQRLGSAAVPGCPGLFLPLRTPRTLANTTTDAAGDASTPPAFVPAGIETWVMAVYPATCEISCVAYTEF